MDKNLRDLQRLAATGSEEARKRYIAALERVVGIGTEEISEVYEAKDKQWFRSISQTFPPTARIFKETTGGMLDIHFERLGSLGFTLAGFPKEHWDWLLGSLSSQVSELIDRAYKKGVSDAQGNIRRAMGLD